VEIVVHLSSSIAGKRVGQAEDKTTSRRSRESLAGSTGATKAGIRCTSKGLEELGRAVDALQSDGRGVRALGAQQFKPSLGKIQDHVARRRRRSGKRRSVPVSRGKEQTLVHGQVTSERATDVGTPPYGRKKARAFKGSGLRVASQARESRLATRTPYAGNPELAIGRLARQLATRTSTRCGHSRCP
jgi:hypothetical protein